MRLLVNYLTRKRNGNLARRSQEVECDSAEIGRGQTSEVLLPDPRISLHMALLHLRSNRLHLETLSGDTLTIDGNLTNSGRVDVGSTVELGPYEIKFVAPPDHLDASITVELIRAMGDDLEHLKERSQTDLSDTWLSLRSLSWLAALFVLTLFLAWPITAYFTSDQTSQPFVSAIESAKQPSQPWPISADLAWNTGELSDPHKFLGDKCSSCHKRPFEQVTDAVCSACHKSIGQHADPKKFPLPELSESTCQSCHKEHLGAAHIVTRDQAFCADCHRDITNIAEASKLENVSGIGDNHGEFRPTIIKDARQNLWKRQALDLNNWPTEQSNLKFNHKKHLAPGGIRDPRQTQHRIMQCKDCHLAEPGRAAMAEITMEKNCISCHRIQFEPKNPERTLPHGKPDQVAEQIAEFYKAAALEGTGKYQDAPPSVRRRPGTELSPPQRREALAWAEGMASRAAENVFGKTVCKTCHLVSRKQTETGVKWHIAPVKVTGRWMPKGRFDHKAHETTTCLTCHKADVSELATDVLLPPIKNCQTCHGNENAQTRVPSTCVMCHDFHLQSHPVARQNAAITSAPRQ